MSARAIHGYTYETRGDLRYALSRAIERSGGQMVLEEPLSEHALGVELELPLNCIVDLYGELARLGMEFTRSGQMALAELCTMQRHARSRKARGHLHLRLEVSMLQGISLEMLLAGGGPAA